MLFGVSQGGGLASRKDGSGPNFVSIAPEPKAPVRAVTHMGSVTRATALKRIKLAVLAPQVRDVRRDAEWLARRALHEVCRQVRATVTMHVLPEPRSKRVETPALDFARQLA